MAHRNRGTGMRRVLIAGCGYVGSAVAERLVTDGCEVWEMRRNPTSLPAGVRPIAADLGAPATLRDLPAELDTVFYTAAADGSTEDAYRAAYVVGLGNLLAALPSPPRRIIFTSSTSV
ncbi:MAG TPA: NAD-dependent epimerase/dehydratase family protein, partial [Longimicrobium sp.]